MVTPGLVAANRQPNIVFIYADDLGFGDLFLLWCNEKTSNVDGLQDGIVSCNAHSARLPAIPSRSTIDGEYPWQPERGLRPAMRLDYQPERAPFPNIERSRYMTGAVGKWHLGWAVKRGNKIGTTR